MMAKTYQGQVLCPIGGCDYWCCFGGHLDPFIKAFKKHLRKDHDELAYGDTRDVGGFVDRWVGDLIVGAHSEPVAAVQSGETDVSP
jgi:hypothetical protein